ncbi:very-long-chain 3-oxoacyl-CoA reductase-like protein [Senna tora]|uniref:Very-long-chain 3-oxoacyl-CoA reductase-like protein n=1 Tax=Senna tora TaxID=362788 RepID=A0A834W930_9FABA|nr:very-long-chain 3-oxoacyl-CoA reductase-like protein [Senna tora]
MTARVASIEKASIFVASAKDYAEAGIRRIGYEIECSPYWSHSLQSYFASFVPHFLLDAWRLSIGIRRSRHIITPHHPIHLPN